MSNTLTSAGVLLNQGWGQPPKSKDQIMQEWLDAEKALSAAKETEMTLRKQVVGLFPELDAKKEGTVYAPLANGWQLKCVKKQNYNLNDKNGATDKALEAYENGAGTPEEHGRRKLITERLVSWKPSLSIKEYRDADADLLKALEGVLTITDGAPALELVEPKAGK